MKSIIVIILFYYAFSLNAQEIIFISIDSTIKGTKDELFVRAKSWLVQTFKSANDVIQLNDKEAGKLLLFMPAREAYWVRWIKAPHASVARYSRSGSGPPAAHTAWRPGLICVLPASARIAIASWWASASRPSEGDRAPKSHSA